MHDVVVLVVTDPSLGSRPRPPPGAGKAMTRFGFSKYGEGGCRRAVRLKCVCQDIYMSAYMIQAVKV